MDIVDVEVIAAQGAVITGPARIRITPEQHAPRHAVLGPWVEGGVFDLDGGRRLSFKQGEVLGVALPEGRLNSALFRWEADETMADDAKADEAKADDAKADEAKADDAKAPQGAAPSSGRKGRRSGAADDKGKVG